MGASIWLASLALIQPSDPVEMGSHDDSFAHDAIVICAAVLMLVIGCVCLIMLASLAFGEINFAGHERAEVEPDFDTCGQALVWFVFSIITFRWLFRFDASTWARAGKCQARMLRLEALAAARSADSVRAAEQEAATRDAELQSRHPMAVAERRRRDRIAALAERMGGE